MEKAVGRIGILNSDLFSDWFFFSVEAYIGAMELRLPYVFSGSKFASDAPDDPIWLKVSLVAQKFALHAPDDPLWLRYERNEPLFSPGCVLISL